MTNRMSEQLLGYIFDALDPSERMEVERHLENDIDWQIEHDKISRSMQPMFADDRQQAVPPPGLVERTCAYVEQQIQHLAELDSDINTQPIYQKPIANRKPVVQHHFRSMHGDNRVDGRGPIWRMLDVFTITGVTAMSFLLIIPAINTTKFHADIRQCQDNLRQIGQQLTEYSSIHSGAYPEIPQQGELSAAGIYAPILKESGLLPDDGIVLCPDSPQSKNPDYDIPTISTLKTVARQTPAQLVTHREKMGGSYAYSLGYTDEKGRYQQPKNLHRTNFPVMADAPPTENLSLASLHHAGRGQNVLYEDGHVQFVTTPHLIRPYSSSPEDHLYLNDRDQPAAGMHFQDAVLGRSNQAPIRFISSP